MTPETGGATHTSARVINPVHDTYFEGDNRGECYDWIESFAGEANTAIVATGPDTYKVGNFNLYIREDREAG